MHTNSDPIQALCEVIGRIEGLCANERELIARLEAGRIPRADEKMAAIRQRLAEAKQSGLRADATLNQLEGVRHLKLVREVEK